MKIFTKYLLTSLCLLTQIVHAQTLAPKQDKLHILQAVEQFLQTQTIGQPGEINITLGQLDPRLSLPACAAPEAFLPNGARAWGKTTVGVRCSAPTAWTIYVSATVHVMADYLTAAVPLAQGQSIGQNDIARVKGDLTTLPQGIISDQAQALGHTVTTSLPLGAPLRKDLLRTQQAIQQGQAVRLVSSGAGFRVSTEAIALANATEGQTIQARTPVGQLVSGIAKMGGIVEVSF